MLPFRRVIAFSSRVHTYLLGLYLFFSIIYFLTLAFPSQIALVTLVFQALDLISWGMIIYGLWIIISSLIGTIISRVFIVAPLVLTLLRVAAMLLISMLISFSETLIQGGITL